MAGDETGRAEGGLGRPEGLVSVVLLRRNFDCPYWSTSRRTPRGPVSRLP